MKYIVLAIMASLAGCGPEEGCGSAGMAEIMAQKRIRSLMVDPDSTEFVQTSSTESRTFDSKGAKEQCLYTVDGELRSKNGFGGFAAAAFTVKLYSMDVGRTWAVIYQEVEQ